MAPQRGGVLYGESVSAAIEKLVSGVGADRLGVAFREGYAAALRALVPGLPEGEVVALAATEEGGGHPKAIQTRFSDGKVTGRKTFVTMGTVADRVLVVAREAGGGEAEEGRLRVVSVTARQPGVVVRPLPPPRCRSRVCRGRRWRGTATTST